MKVGMIGNGHMAEGIARRMMANDINVIAYQNNYEKSCEQYEAGYITGCTTSMPLLVNQVKQKLIYGVKSSETVVSTESGIFMLVVPSFAVEHTLDELLPLLDEGDIIIDYSGNDIISCKELELYCSKLGIAYVFAGVYGANHAITACSKIFQSLSPGNVTRV